MIKRREFIRQSLILGGGVLSGASLFKNRSPEFTDLPTEFSDPLSEPEVVTILYTNDTHGRIDPFPQTAREHAGLGGISRRASLVKRIRQESPNSLLLDAGDAFYGSPWFTLYGGKRHFELMSLMGYDAMALGEHEFHHGLEGFAEAAGAADFPFLCANYRVTGTAMEPFVQPYLIREVGGVRFGIFGLGVALHELVPPEKRGEVRVGEPISRADTVVRFLKEQRHCDYIICLSHLGYHYEDSRPDDRKLAASIEGLDLIIGGHTHTFMDQPEMILSADGGQTLVTQVGHSGIRLGRIDLKISGERRVEGLEAQQYTMR